MQNKTESVTYLGGKSVFLQYKIFPVTQQLWKSVFPGASFIECKLLLGKNFLEDTDHSPAVAPFPTHISCGCDNWRSDEPRLPANAHITSSTTSVWSQPSAWSPSAVQLKPCRPSRISLSKAFRTSISSIKNRISRKLFSKVWLSFLWMETLTVKGGSGGLPGAPQGWASGPAKRRGALRCRREKPQVRGAQGMPLGQKHCPSLHVKSKDFQGSRPEGIPGLGVCSVQACPIPPLGTAATLTWAGWSHSVDLKSPSHLLRMGNTLYFEWGTEQEIPNQALRLCGPALGRRGGSWRIQPGVEVGGSCLSPAPGCKILLSKYGLCYLYSLKVIRKNKKMASQWVFLYAEKNGSTTYLVFSPNLWNNIKFWRNKNC